MYDNWEKIKNGQYIVTRDQRKKELKKNSQILLKNLAKCTASLGIAYLAGLAVEPDIIDWPDVIESGAVFVACAFGALTIYNVPKWMKSLINVNKAPEKIVKYPNDEFAEENIENIRNATINLNELIGNERRQNIITFLDEDVIEENKTK